MMKDRDKIVGVDAATLRVGRTAMWKALQKARDLERERWDRIVMGAFDRARGGQQWYPIFDYELREAFEEGVLS